MTAEGDLAAALAELARLRGAILDLANEWEVDARRLRTAGAGPIERGIARRLDTCIGQARDATDTP